MTYIIYMTYVTYKTYITYMSNAINMTCINHN